MRHALIALLIVTVTVSTVRAQTTRTWDGTTGSWSDPTKWTGSTVPQAGENAVINGGAVMLSADTFGLASLTMGGGTLTFTNWSTRLIASNVVLNSGSTLTLPGPFLETQMSNRVHVVCTTFALASGATVDADAQGFAGGTSNVDPGDGPGGGGVVSYYGAGGGYGGRGGNGKNDGGKYSNGGGGKPYGSTTAPLSPGSGGGGTGVHDGGGAVRIDASGGTVTVNGTITANGAGASQHGGGGSGGAIYIGCKTFAGTATGLLSADGGAGGTINNWGGGGGGGRIAVVYDSVDSPRPGVRFSVAPGSSLYDPGQIGTVYLPDEALLSEAMPNLLNVRIYGITNWSVGQISMTNSKVWLAQEDLQMRVTNNIHVDSGAGLTLPGGMTLTCGGDVVLTNGGTLGVHGKIVSVPTDYGSLVMITNDLIVGPGSWVYPYSHTTNGGSPLFRVSGDVTIAETGGFDGSGLGFYGGTYAHWAGYGPGGGPAGGNVYYGGGAGYGGGGGAGTAGVGGGTYGETNAPVRPGSGGSSWSGGHGGGSVRIQASGTVTVDGTIRVDGDAGGEPGQDLIYGGGGSGGGVFITGSAFSGGANALISADGADGKHVSNGGGGGGRIAIGIGISETDIALLIAGQAVTGLNIYPDYVPYLGTLSVTNGDNGAGIRAGTPGTKQFMQVSLGGTFTLTIAGNPANYDSPSPDSYGPHPNVAENTVITNSVTSPADEAAGQRWLCLGWSATNDAGTVLASGTTTQAVVQITNDTTLVWNWTNELELSASAGPNGTVNTGTVNGWYTNGTVVSGILASPDGGYGFHQWTGAGVPSGQRLVNPLAVTMDQARPLVANFYSLAGQTRTWNGSVDNWNVPSEWTPVGVPELLDDVIIPSGTVTIDTPQWVRSITATNATLVLTNWTTALYASNVTLRSGVTVTLPPAFTDSQMSNRVHVVCSNFTMAAGAVIDTDGRGYSGALAFNLDGHGPGKGLITPTYYYGSGGGHGGRGGDGISGIGGPAYDSTNAPVIAGSGGSGTSAGAGGGAVRIDATAHVGIDGTINADGKDGPSHGGGGSGGAIYISCRTFGGAGSGLLTADGGHGGGSGDEASGGGAGGRIAVTYDKAAQSTAPSPGVRLSVAAGTNTHAKAEDGEIGTVYLPDTALLTQTLENFLNVRLYGVTNWAPSHVALTNSLVWFGEQAFLLDVTNGVTCGVGSSLVMPAYSTLQCGGGLTLGDGGSLSVYGGVTNPADPDYSSLVSVGKDVSIGAGSWVYPYGHTTNDAAMGPLFRMRHLSITSGGGFDADGKGYAGGTATTDDGYGPGKGEMTATYYGGGGAHGGAGGDGSGGPGGSAYDATNAPVKAGSGGGGFIAGTGGGSIRIEASGTVTLNGTLTANGKPPKKFDFIETNGGGGAGGAIFVRCNSFGGGVSGELSAAGTIAGPAGSNSSGAGGGGRIAIWHGAVKEADATVLAADGFVANSVITNAHVGFLGSVSATNGINTLYPARSGEPGTIVFVTVEYGATATLLLLR